MPGPCIDLGINVHFHTTTGDPEIPSEEITYYHVELPGHDAIMAEALPTESFLDAGARRLFANNDDVIELFPNFGTRVIDPVRVWDASGCAPLVISGPRLHAVRRRLEGSGSRSGRIGPRRLEHHEIEILQRRG
jgi:hypothetical protein